MESSRIYLTEAAAILNKDKRTIKTWCLCHGIFLYSDGQHGRKYMSRVQFICAWNKEFISEYQERFGEKWFEALEAHINVDALMAIKLGALRVVHSKVKRQNYKPTQKESLVLSRLTGKL